MTPEHDPDVWLRRLAGRIWKMEVKLDLIEAAIHVLDARTREAAVSGC